MNRKGMTLGVDIGGTFTDFCIVDRATGRFHVGKRLTTPDDPSEGFLDGAEQLLVQAGETMTGLANIAHATTLVTNALIERKGSRTGLLVTKGIRDVLVMGRESRYDNYDLRLRRPEPLIPRHLTREVDERIGWDGRILRPLDEESVRQALRELVAEGVESVAVSLLHSYRNPDHERQIAQWIAAEFPGLDCSLSSTVAPEIREYDRTSTVAANAYVRPLVRRYVTQLDAELKRRGFRGEFHVMLSNGGIATTETAAAIPIRATESGPAAGALAAARFAQLLGKEKILAFDMGGTTAKISFIQNGQPRLSQRFEAARVERFKKGSGLPLSIPVIELIEIGAGGGSIAHLDSLGLLKVGPKSASASPGPACYGRGGEEPTVTDADLLLGYIDADRFLGGEMQLDRGAAERVMQLRLGGRLGLASADVARGISAVVNANMATAAKLYAAEQGVDIRQFTMIAFGGAGPIHAHRMAEILGIGTIVYPFGAGVASAIGLCIAPPATEVSHTYLSGVDQLDWQQVRELYREMEDQAKAMVCAAGAQPGEVTLSRVVDMRFKGQGYEVEVPLDGIEPEDGSLNLLRAAFTETYRRSFGRTPAGGELETVTWRLKARGRSHSLDLRPQVNTGGGQGVRRTERLVYSEARSQFHAVPVYDRYALQPGAQFSGPALIEERETTVVVGEGASVVVDPYLNLIVTRGES